MSVSTVVFCYDLDKLDIKTLIDNGELTLSKDDDLILLDYDSDSHNIQSVTYGDGVPVSAGQPGILYRDMSSGYLYFSDETDYHCVGMIETRDGVNVISRVVKEPPELAQVGDQYVVPTGGSSWSGPQNHIARLTNDSWLYVVPTKDQRIGVIGEGVDYVFSGHAWIKDTTSMRLTAMPGIDV